MFKEFGLVPEGLTFSKEAKQMGKGSVLMADEQKQSELCMLIDKTSSYTEIRMAFINTSIKHQELIEILEKKYTDTTNTKNILLTVKSILCETSN